MGSSERIMSKEEIRILRKANRQKYKWAKGLPKELVDEVLKFDIKDVTFVFNLKNCVICQIATNDNKYGRGVAICSTIDQNKKYYSRQEGRVKALGLALGALKRRGNKYQIRGHYEDFPASWTRGQIENVMTIAKAFIYRSSYWEA
jgi:hypothetical protein